MTQSFEERWARLRDEIAEAAARSGRNPDEVALVGVSKGHPPERLREAYDAGFRLFAENRVAELLDKQSELELPDIEWHFLGHIQRRKTKSLVGQVALIHSVDRLDLAESLSSRAVAMETHVMGLLQVNASGEASKGGWQIQTDEGQEALFRDVEQMIMLPAFKLRGLMTMAPFFEDAAQTQPIFERVRRFQAALREHYPNEAWSMLSMGMSNDFRYAIAEGATHLRIGTALFGPRSR